VLQVWSESEGVIHTGQTPADHWRQAQRRGHSRGEGTLWPTMATWRWWCDSETDTVNQGADTSNDTMHISSQCHAQLRGAFKKFVDRHS